MGQGGGTHSSWMSDPKVGGSSMSSTATRKYLLPRRNPDDRAVCGGRGGPTFGPFAEKWMARQTALAHGGLLRISSLHRYKSTLRAHLLPFFAARRLDSITRAHCDDFRMAAISSGRLNPGTVNSIMQILRLILRAAVREGLADQDPLNGMRPLLVPRRLIEPYDRREIRRLIAAMPPADRLVVGLAGLGGLRQGEVYAIRPGDVDVLGRRLWVRRSL